MERHQTHPFRKIVPNRVEDMRGFHNDSSNCHGSSTPDGSIISAVCAEDSDHSLYIPGVEAGPPRRTTLSLAWNEVDLKEIFSFSESGTITNRREASYDSMRAHAILPTRSISLRSRPRTLRRTERIVTCAHRREVRTIL